MDGDQLSRHPVAAVEQQPHPAHGTTHRATADMGQPESILNHKKRQRDRLQRAAQHAWPRADAQQRRILTALLAAVEADQLKASDASHRVAELQRLQQSAAA